jgi:hypothetical protein
VVVVLGVLEVAEPELMSVLLPVVEPVEPVLLPVPEAPMEVPLPVLVLEPVEPVLEPLAVVSVLLVLGVVLLPELEPVMLPLPLELGEVVEGEVLEVLDELEPAPASSFLPQADRDKAAIRARAAHWAIGDLIIRNSLWVSFRGTSKRDDSVARCLRLTLVRANPDLVVSHCRTM